MSPNDEPPHYRAYLLRLWSERGQQPGRSAVWRMSLEDPHTGERRAFAGIERLIAFLRQLMDDNADYSSLDGNKE